MDELHLNICGGIFGVRGAIIGGVFDSIRFGERFSMYNFVDK